MPRVSEAEALELEGRVREAGAVAGGNPILQAVDGILRDAGLRRSDVADEVYALLRKAVECGREHAAAPRAPATGKDYVPTNRRQVGGSHYRARRGQQHWDRAWDLYREAWFVLNVTKYVECY